jgi:AcrR family transcriptional regulator
MSPRGVAIPGLRERLFSAAARVLLRAGPAGLTSRAVTTEAQCAKGLLHARFGSLDAFLAAFVLDRVHRAAERTALLPGRAGTGRVADNLAAAALELPEGDGWAISTLLAARPAVAALAGAGFAGSGGLRAVEESFAGYLAAEQSLGRVAADADVRALAVSLVGAVHHVLLTREAAAAELPGLVRGIVAALLGQEPDPEAG